MKLLQAACAIALVFMSSCASSKIRTLTLNVDNTSFLDREITMSSFEKDVNYLIKKRKSLPLDQTMYIVIPSGGGSTDVETALSHFIELLPNVELICKYCASAAGALFVESSHKRLVIKKSQLMMHEMYIPKVTAKLLQIPGIFNNLIEDSDRFNAIFYSRLKMSREQYEQKILNTEWTLNGKEILDNNLADELVNVECDQDLKYILIETCKP